MSDAAERLDMLARQFDEFGYSLMGHAGTLNRLIAETRWQSTAATQRRQRLSELSIRLRSRADAVCDGADVLRAHARELRAGR